MLFKARILEGIASGRVTLAFRRWTRPRAQPGTRLRTGIGIVEVQHVATVGEKEITSRDAGRAGFASRAELLASLPAGAGRIHRIVLGFGGADPRIALRQRKPSGEREFEEIEERLARLERRRGDAWTGSVLALIAGRPGVRAADLAKSLGRETKPFKTDVRKLKELGLTQSLDVGYRLSPRGRALLDWRQAENKIARRKVRRL